MKKFSKVVCVFVCCITCLIGCGKSENSEDIVQQTKMESSDSSYNDDSMVETPSMEDEKNEIAIKTDIIEDTDDGIIRFRGIRWYSTKKDVENYLVESGSSTGGWSSSDNDIYRMSGINYTNVTMGSDRVDGGGYKGRYPGVSVAGYAASGTYACYIYPINEDGSVNISEDDAQFYFGWYEFTQDDYADIPSIYEDLKTKLCTLYGDGQENETKYHITMTWKDTENNQVRLLMNTDSTYITLGYMAAGAEERLDEMESALDRMNSQKESKEREENKENTSGL